MAIHDLIHVRRGRWKSQPRNREHVLLRLAPLRASGGAHYTGLKEVEAGATVRAHTQQNPPGCHEGVGSNGPIGLPPYEVLRLGSPANTGGPRGARAGPSSLRVTNGKGKGKAKKPNSVATLAIGHTPVECRVRAD